VQQEHLESAHLLQGQYGPDPKSISGVRIRTTTPDDFQNLTGNSLSKDTCVIIFYEDPIDFPEDGSKYRKMPYLAVLKNPFKIPGSIAGSGWFPKFFLVHRRVIGGKICMKIRSIRFLCEVNKQTDKRRIKHNPLGGGNNADTHKISCWAKAAVQGDVRINSTKSKNREIPRLSVSLRGRNYRIFRGWVRDGTQAHEYINKTFSPLFQ